MTDMLVKLTHASWRGIQFPTVDRDFRDDELIESIGRENPTYRYTIPMREDIAKGPWKNLFVKVYPKFLNACLDRTNGLLDDPVHGILQAKCVSLEETLTSGRRDGVDVTASFVSSPDEDFSREDLGAVLSTLEGARGVAAFFDKETGKLSAATKKQIADLNKGSEFAKVDLFSFTTGVIDQINLTQNKLLSKVGQVVSKAERLDKSLGRLKEPKSHSLRNSARRLEQTSRNLVDHATGSTVGKNKRVRQYVVPADIGRLALASVLHTDIGDFLKLNPGLASTPTVRSGTRVFYFETGEFATLSSFAQAATAVPVARSTLGV
jgi:hypothetical protein